MRSGRLSLLVPFSLATTLWLACGGGGVPAAPSDGGVPIDGGADAGMRRPPVAVPGTDRSGDVFSEIQFDGSASYAPNGDPITAYAWILIQRPEDSTAAIRDSDRARGYLTPDVRGVYRIGLVVYTTVASPRAELRLTVSDECCRPIARAPASLEVGLTEEVTLDGRASSDPRSMALTYQWRITQAPPSTSATLSDAAAPSARFRPDPSAPHATYAVELAVADSQLASAPVVVQLSVRNSLPVVTLGGNRTILPGASIALAAVASDADHDALTYTWRILSQPAQGASVTQRSGAPNEALFVAEANLVGDYTVECTVDDAHGGVARASVTLSARNSPPTVAAGEDQTVDPRCDASGTCTAIVDLAGTATDPEGDALTIVWDRVSPGATPQPSNAGHGTVQFTSTSTLATRATISAADGRAAGTYLLRLRAKDALHDAQSSTLVVTVTNRAPRGDIDDVAPDGHRTTQLPFGTTRYEATFALTSLAQDPDFGDTDPNGSHLLYNWTGPQPGESADPATVPIFSNATNRTTNVTLQRDCPPGACPASPGFLGDYTVHVSVADQNGASTTSDVILTVSNRPPTLALAPAAQGVAPGTVARIVANAADPDGDALAYAFELVPGTGGSLTTSGNTATLATSSGLVTHEVRVTVTDAFGATASQLAHVTTNPSPIVAPFARQVIGHTCTPAAGAALCTAQVELRGSATDADALTFEWSAVTAPPDRPNVVAALSAPANAPTRTLTLTSGPDGALAGTYALRFCARDPYNEPVCVPIEVVVTNSAPTDVSAGAPQSIAHHAEPAGSRTFAATFTLQGSGRDPDFGTTPPEQQKLAFRWSNPAPSELTFDPTLASPTVTLSKRCETTCAFTPYPFTLTVSDPNGATATASTLVTIGNSAPSIDLQPASADIRDTDSQAFTILGTDADSDGLTYDWDLSALPSSFVVTTLGNGVTIQPAPLAYGVYPIRVRASDGLATSNQATASLRVNSPPRATAPAEQLSMAHTCTDAGVCSATSSTLSATAFDADPGDVPRLTYEWSADPSPDATGPLSITFSSPTDLAPTVRIQRNDGQIAGTYALRFCVYDPLHPKLPSGSPPHAEQCAKTSMTVQNQPPRIVAVATPYVSVPHSAASPILATTYRSARAVLGLTARDPESSLDNTNLSFEWTLVAPADPIAKVYINDQLAAPTVRLEGTTGASPTVVIVKDCTTGCSPGPGLLGNYEFSVVAIDRSGARSTTPAQLTVNVTNAAPNASNVSPLQQRFPAGVGAFTDVVGSRVRAGAEVRFATLSSDPDGDAVQTSWSILSQPGTRASLDASNPIAPVLMTEPGAPSAPTSYTISVTRTDPFGQSTSDSGTIAIDRPPRPVASATPRTARQTCPSAGQCLSETIALSVDPQDPDDTTGFTFAWTVTKPANRPNVFADLNQSASQSPSLTIRSPAIGGPIDGDYLCIVTVTDRYGESATASTTVTVLNSPPTLNSAVVAAGPFFHRAASNVTTNTLYASDPVAATATAQDPESPTPNLNVSFVWTVVAKADPVADVLINDVVVPLNGSVTLSDAAGATPTIQVRKDCSGGCAAGPGFLGGYAVTVRAVDLGGQSSATSPPLSFVVQNRAPTVSVTPVSLLARQQAAQANLLSVNGASDADNDALAYSWTLVGAPAGVTLSSATGTTTTLSTPAGLTAAARFQVQLTARDPFGSTATAATTVTVNTPPIVGVAVQIATSEQGTSCPAPASYPCARHYCTSTARCSNSPDQSDARANISLNVSAKTVAGSPRFAWSALNAPSPTSVRIIANPSSSSQFQAYVERFQGDSISMLYVLSLQTTDDAGDASDTPVYFQVGNQPPTASPQATNASLAHTTTFTNSFPVYSAGFNLQGSGSDPECTDCTTTADLTYEWTFVSGPDPKAVVTFSDPTNPVAPPTAGLTTLRSPSVTIKRDCSIPTNPAQPIGPSNPSSCGTPPYAPGTVLLSDATRGDYVINLVVIDPNGQRSAPAPITLTVTNEGPKNAPQAGSGPGTPVPHSYVAGGSPLAYQTSISTAGSPATAPADNDPLTYEWSLRTSALNVCLVASQSSTACSNSIAAPLSATLFVRGDAGLITTSGTSHQLCLMPVDPWGLRLPPTTPLGCLSFDVKNDTPTRPSFGYGTVPATSVVNHQYLTGAQTYSTILSPVSPSGASSDTEGDPVTYAWISPADAAGVSITYPSTSPTPQSGSIQLSSSTGSTLVRAAPYHICLRATDSLGATSDDCRDVLVVNRAPTPSTAGFTDNVSVGYVNQGTSFTATIPNVLPSIYADPDSDPQGSPAFLWYEPGPTAVNVTGPAPGQTGSVTLSASSLSALQNLTHRVCLETRDGFGAGSPLVDGTNCRHVYVGNTAPTIASATASASRVVFVAAPNAQGVCGCFSSTVCKTATLTLGATATDPNGGPLTYAWTSTATPSGCGAVSAQKTCAAGVACSTSIAGACVGTYTFSVRATDEVGAQSAASSVSVTVQSTCAPSTDVICYGC